MDSSAQLGVSGLPPGVTVHTRAECDLAAAEWLVQAAGDRHLAVSEWQRDGTAWLRPGVLFSAVSVSADLVHAAIGTDQLDEVGEMLRQVLDETPVWFTPGEDAAYTALLPPSAVAHWHVPDTRCASQDGAVRVPLPGGETADDEPRWVVPMTGPGAVGSPALLASLVAVGRQRLAAEAAGDEC